MKQTIIQILTIVLLIMAFPFDSSGKDKVVDFNFPQDVSKEALTDLDKALKTGDGELTVDALVRYSLAQSGISQDNAADIISRVEATAAREKQPHIRALLYHLEAMIYQGYRDRYARWSNRENPVEETPADISEWDRKQFDKKIVELIEKSLADPTALKAIPVASLPGIIRCNELGATYVPTLREFLLTKGLDMTQGIDLGDDTLAERIKADWLAATESDIPAHIYALTQIQTWIPIETYRQYQDNEHCAFLLNQIGWENDKEHYKALQEYVARFPNSIYMAEVKNSITHLESKTVYLNYPSVRSSSDSIWVKADVTNANTFMIKVYQIPEQEYKRDTYGVDRSKLQLVSTHTVNVQGTVPFTAEASITLPPLPYGAYIFYPVFGEDFYGMPGGGVYRDDILHVTDIALFTISRNDHKDCVGAVDINTGKPVQGVTIKDDNGKSLGSTGADGTLAIQQLSDDSDDLGLGFLFAIKGNDRFGPSGYYDRVEDRSINNNDAEVYTDLGVYRPSETIQWAAIVYNWTEKERKVLPGKPIVAIFKDSNQEPIDTVTMTTDEYGRIEGTFLVPKDRMNGTFGIQFEEKGPKNKALAYHPVTVSEYKTPTFEVTFPDARLSYVAGQPVKVTGKAMTYSGLPVQNSEVRLSLSACRSSRSNGHGGGGT